MNTRLSLLTSTIDKFFLFVFTVMASVFAFAQETTEPLDVDITTTKTTTTTTEEWITNPLYWVIGALFLVIIIAIIARGNRK